MKQVARKCLWCVDQRTDRFPSALKRIMTGQTRRFLADQNLRAKRLQQRYHGMSCKSAQRLQQRYAKPGAAL
ncbi:hypothetical protein A6R70_16645 [Agrobacterium rubi]|nr:hypothetical protein [Agrobacterium rubi]